MSDLVERLNEVVQKAWANGWWKGRVQRDVAEAVEEIERLEAQVQSLVDRSGLDPEEDQTNE